MSNVLPHDVSVATRARAERLPHRPRNCVWELTLACNLRCAHCGSRAGRPRDRELDTAECLDVVAQLAALQCDLVTLSGGEPLLRRDWDVIARAAADLGIYVNLVTNGTLVDRDVARRTVDAGLVNVGVSVDGPEDLHDGIRGKGAFARTMAGIANLRAVGMSVGVLTHVNRQNLARLQDVRRVALEAGAATWRLQLGKPMGSMTERQDLLLRPRDLLTLVPEIARLKALGGIGVSVGDSIGYYGTHDKALRGRGWRGGRAESWQGCQAGLQAIGIESDGGIKGCLSMQAEMGDGDPFREGTVTDTSLAELWFREGAFPYNREFRADSLTGFCRRCAHASVCKGGARCVAAAATGALGEDPFCYHRVIAMHGDGRLRTAIARSAAAASAALLIGAAGCGSDDAQGWCPSGAVCDEIFVPDVVQDVVPATEDVVATDAKADAIDCQNVCCLCDYGIIPEEVYQACCTNPEPAPDTSADAVQPDVPPTDVAPAEVAPADLAAPDAIDCGKVCCECEYGIIPTEVWDYCCANPEPLPDAIQPDVLPPADVAPADLAAPDALDCSQVCCLCDYGIIPEEVYQACCVNPEPAAEPTPDVAPTETVDHDAVALDISAAECAKQKCLTDNSMPADVRAACCEICKDPGFSCCMCDYGINPPGQCCW